MLGAIEAGRISKGAQGKVYSQSGKADLSAADLSALWLAAFETVQSGACPEVTGGGVKTPSDVDSPGVYFITCGLPASAPAPQRWYRQDAHGVERCADAVSCASP